MRLTSSTQRTDTLAPALPVRHPALEKAGFRPRRGQLSLTVAAPGRGKSQLWQNLAHRMGVPTVYWSADTDRHDVLVRAAAMWSGSTVQDVDVNMSQPAWAAHYEKAMRSGAHVEWVFDPAIEPDRVKERLLAFAEVHGEFPHLFVVDNLSNTVQSQGDELAEQKQALIALQRLARESHAHIAVLAHAKGAYEDGTKPIPQGGVLNNLAKWPELVVTLHQADDSGRLLGLNVVKNRSGRADPGAKHPLHLNVDFGSATVGGFAA